MSEFVCIIASHFEREGSDLVGFVKAQWLECQDGTPNVFHWGGQKGHVSADVLLFFLKKQKVLPCSSSKKIPHQAPFVAQLMTHRQ